MIERFGDPERGGFFSTADDHEELIARRKEVGDHPIPSGNSSAAMGLLRLAALTGERRYEERAPKASSRLFAEPAVQHPDAFAHLLQALDFHLSPTREVALVGDLGELRRSSASAAPPRRPRRRPRGPAAPLLAGGHRRAPDAVCQASLRRPRHCRRPSPAAYVCEDFDLPGCPVDGAAIGAGPAAASAYRGSAGSSRSRTG